MNYKSELLSLISNISFQYNDKEKFLLSSGEKSNYYIDCRKITLNSLGSFFIGKIFYDEIKDLNIKGIGGMTLGADPIAYSCMYESYKNNKFIDTFIIRKEEKDHGLKKRIEGNIKSGDHIVIVDDVITTGKSTIESINICLKNNFIIDKIIILLDRRENNGIQNIKNIINCPIISIFNITDVFNYLNIKRL